MKKIAVVVGHNPVQKGAYARKPLSTSEYPFNLSVANRMLELSADEDFDIKVITRAYVGSYRRNKNRKTRSAATVEIRAAYKEVQEYNPDYSMELHFNGHSSKRAVGSEVLSSGSRGSVRFAKVCQAIQADTFRHRGRRNRGIKFPK
ncbi:MAG: N-acetylmuramoyl-L-alanine amidase, partial [Bacteroidota bacterium]